MVSRASCCGLTVRQRSKMRARPSALRGPDSGSGGPVPGSAGTRIKGIAMSMESSSQPARAGRRPRLRPAPPAPPVCGAETVARYLPGPAAAGVAGGIPARPGQSGP